MHKCLSTGSQTKCRSAPPPSFQHSPTLFSSYYRISLRSLKWTQGKENEDVGGKVGVVGLEPRNETQKNSDLALPTWLCHLFAPPPPPFLLLERLRNNLPPSKYSDHIQQPLSFTNQQTKLQSHVCLWFHVCGQLQERHTSAVTLWGPTVVLWQF